MSFEQAGIWNVSSGFYNAALYIRKIYFNGASGLSWAEKTVIYCMLESERVCERKKDNKMWWILFTPQSNVNSQAFLTIFIAFLKII